jgi:hypothetical protein
MVFQKAAPPRRTAAARKPSTRTLAFIGKKTATQTNRIINDKLTEYSQLKKGGQKCDTSD